VIFDPSSSWYDSAVNVAFFIFGQIPVYTFPLIVGVSAAVGLILITWPVAAFPNLAHLRLNIGCAVLTGALIGGRVGYVWVNWPHFQEYWAEIPQVWLGGLSWPGALAGAILALAAITLRQKFTENFPSNTLTEKSRKMASDLYDRLKQIAVDNVLDEQITDEMMMNASFLIKKETVNKFRELITEFDKQYTDLLKIRISGPTAPYNFVDMPTKPM